ncbi:MAG TPA: hypothetical protein VKS21_03825, partial [Spirochaetota bacterium]|nr:hypothetical protein [Spirochaetota bacterium]
VDYFEAIIRRNQHTAFYNLSLYGRKINGLALSSSRDITALLSEDKKKTGLNQVCCYQHLDTAAFYREQLQRIKAVRKSLYQQLQGLLKGSAGQNHTVFLQQLLADLPYLKDTLNFSSMMVLRTAVSGAQVKLLYNELYKLLTVLLKDLSCVISD